MRVKVYWNFHRKLFSVMDPKTRKVIGHQSDIILQDVEFKVSEAGRKRVLRDRQKNVHAFVIGNIVDHYPIDPSRLVSYNPYRNDQFVDQTECPVMNSNIAKMSIRSGRPTIEVQ